MLITFFILLNALLAIIVESYDRIKEEAEHDHSADPASLILRKMLGASAHGGELSGAYITEEELQRVFKDIHLNLESRERVSVPGMKVRVSDHPMDGPEAGSSPKKDPAAAKRNSRRNR